MGVTHRKDTMWYLCPYPLLPYRGLSLSGFDKGTCTTKPRSQGFSLKPRPNDRNLPTQHIATLLDATFACVWPSCCDMLLYIWCCWLKFDHFQTWANNTQNVATHRNTVAKRPQHVAPNNVAIRYVGILRSFSRDFSNTVNNSLINYYIWGEPYGIKNSLLKICLSLSNKLIDLNGRAW